MSALDQQAAMTLDEFLAWEATQPEKHEFIGGEIFDMAGAEDHHVTICLNIAVALRQHLRDSPCRTYMADMKLRVDAANASFFPDVLVTCSAADRERRQDKREPLLLVEVLSPSTAAYDRGDKFSAYRQVDSLREFLIVDLARRRSEVYRKGADGLWVLYPFDTGQTVHLASVELELPAAVVYADVDAAEGPAAA
ncbi:Uma2 family endonuclease [Sphaerotilus mobilis]|uniref:Uma2 family endonuclease n=1 Tax=Sphaerotilus mobilis TaxID=47994 RepID=A0A4Q7L9T7_9BURK|nr:Uma2 family endonuclease [Sphaerotilus mobilis]RZS46875.1 Uma2 family endonuclease [Sphaerotilus mobilis]